MASSHICDNVRDKRLRGSPPSAQCSTIARTGLAQGRISCSGDDMREASAERSPTNAAVMSLRNPTKPPPNTPSTSRSPADYRGAAISVLARRYNTSNAVITSRMAKGHSRRRRRPAGERSASGSCDAAFGIDRGSSRRGVTGAGPASFGRSRSARSLSNSLMGRALPQMDQDRPGH
jgi:hypothetical protein